MAEESTGTSIDPALQAEIDRYYQGLTHQEFIDLTDAEVERRAIVLTQAESVGKMAIGATHYWEELDRRIAKDYARRLDLLTKVLSRTHCGALGVHPCSGSPGTRVDSVQSPLGSLPPRSPAYLAALSALQELGVSCSDQVSPQTLLETLQELIIAATTASWAFDRAHYDRLMSLWEALDAEQSGDSARGQG